MSSDEIIKTVIIIVAYRSRDRAIGRGGRLPWKPIKTDMDFFSKETTGHTIVMGAKTYDSIPPRFRPLPNRHNFVVTQNKEALIYPDDVKIFSSISEAIAAAPTEKVFLGGGAGIYREGLEIANTMLATIVHHDDDIVCDVFFPEIPNHWKVVSEGQKGMDERSGITIQFVTMINTKKPPVALMQQVEQSEQ